MAYDFTNAKAAASAATAARMAAHGRQHASLEPQSLPVSIDLDQVRADAAAAERTRILDIMSSPEARTNPALAMELAYKQGRPAAEALASLRVFAGAATACGAAAASDAYSWEEVAGPPQRRSRTRRREGLRRRRSVGRSDRQGEPGERILKRTIEAAPCIARARALLEAIDPSPGDLEGAIANVEAHAAEAKATIVRLAADRPAILAAGSRANLDAHDEGVADATFVRDQANELAARLKVALVPAQETARRAQAAIAREKVEALVAEAVAALAGYPEAAKAVLGILGIVAHSRSGRRQVRPGLPRGAADRLRRGAHSADAKRSLEGRAGPRVGVGHAKMASSSISIRARRSR